MDDGIKQRLIGAVVLVALMVIFLPMFFENRSAETVDISIEIPEKPAIPEFDISKPVSPREKHQPQLTLEDDAKLKLELEPTSEPDKQDLEELAGKKFDANNLPVSWTLQVASFKERTNAEKLRDKLRKSEYKAYIKFRHDVEPQMIRVFVGPVLERKTVDEIKASISKQYQLDGVVVRYLP